MAPGSTNYISLIAKQCWGVLTVFAEKVVFARVAVFTGVFLRWALHTQSSTRSGGADNASTIFSKPKYLVSRHFVKALVCFMRDYVCNKYNLTSVKRNHFYD